MYVRSRIGFSLRSDKIGRLKMGSVGGKTANSDHLKIFSRLSKIYQYFHLPVDDIRSWAVLKIHIQSVY